MLRHEPVLPPEDIYPIHDWRLVEGRLNLKAIVQTETISSQNVTRNVFVADLRGDNALDAGRQR